MSGLDAVGSSGFVALPSFASESVAPVDLSEPLEASLVAVAVVPEAVMVTLIGDAATDRGSALLVVTRYDEDTALVDLGDGYLLTVDRPSASVLLANRATGLQTIIWGDGAAVSLDGSGEAARFWGSMTFALDNGAVITAATAQRADNPLVYVLDALTITRETAAVIISNLSEKVAPSLALTESDDGWRIEQETADGMVLDVGRTGAGWVKEGTTVAADAAWVAETAPNAPQAFAYDELSAREFGRYHAWTSIGLSRLGEIGPTAAVEPSSGDDRATTLRRIYMDSLRPSVTD